MVGSVQVAYKKTAVETAGGEVGKAGKAGTAAWKEDWERRAIGQRTRVARMARRSRPKFR